MNNNSIVKVYICTTENKHEQTFQSKVEKQDFRFRPNGVSSEVRQLRKSLNNLNILGQRTSPFVSNSPIKII